MKLKLAIIGIGICTANIDNVDSLIDVLIDPNLSGKSKKSIRRTAVATALMQAKAHDIPLLAVGTSALEAKEFDDLAKALEYAATQQSAAIVCVQNGSDGLTDAIVLRVQTTVTDSGWALVTEIENTSIASDSPFSRVYNSEGPVYDAGALVCGCIAARYGLNLSMNQSGDCFLDANIYHNFPMKIAVSDRTIMLQQAEDNYPSKIHCDRLAIPVAFTSFQEIKEKLNQLESQVTIISITEIAKSHIEKYDNSRPDSKVVVFVVRDKGALLEEIVLFRKCEKDWFTTGFHWSSPEGSYYTASPIGKNGKICILNPPGGMFLKTPFYRIYRTVPELKQIVTSDKIYKTNDNELVNRYFFETLATKLIYETLKHLGIEINAAIGGSLGEMSLPFIIDCSSLSDEDKNSENSLKEMMYKVIGMLEQILKSQNALCLRYFKYKIDDMEKWYLKCEPERVQSAINNLGKRPSVFLTIIGSPKDTIICGDHKMCANVIDSLQCYATQFRDPIYAHTPVLEPSRRYIQNAVKKKQVHLKEKLPYVVYSTSQMKPLDTSIDMYARNFADCLINQVNMPGIFNKAYEDGCRMFIDLGTSRICSQWARETFIDKKDILITSLYEKDSGPNSLLVLLSQMMSHQITIDKDRFLNRFIWPEADVPAIHEQASEIAITMFETKSNISINNASNEAIESNTKATAVLFSTSSNASGQPLVHGQSNITEKFVSLIDRQIEHNMLAYQSYLQFEKSIVSWIIDSNTTSTISESQEETKDKRKSLYNYNDILVMTRDSMAKVLGPKYKEIDQYKTRARMPLPPYLFVSRITSIQATFGEISAGSYIEAEYDITQDCILRIGESEISKAAFGEASHIGIFLAAYMGVDIKTNGKAKFRITDVSTTYHVDDLPGVGETIRMIFMIDRLVKNGDITLLFCSYKVFKDDQLLISSQEIGGFFDQQTLDNSKGINNIQSKAKKSKGSDIYNPISDKSYFGPEETHAFLAGNYEACFGSANTNISASYEVCEELFLIDRVIEISKEGGEYGLGYIIAEKDVDEAFWPFQSHFLNDPVLPGSIMLEGVAQAVKFFNIYMGLYSNSAKSHIKSGNVENSVFRGEVRPDKHILRYCINPKEVRKVPEGILFVMDASVFCDGIHIIQQKNSASIIG